MRKCFLALFLALVLCLGVLTPCVLAQEGTGQSVNSYATSDTAGDIEIVDGTDSDAAILASGSCGTNLKWSLNYGGTLSISGKGTMTSRPWYNYRKTIKNITISYGATSIYKYAFSGCIALTAISLPPTITSIGASAFYDCTRLKTVTFRGSPAKWNAITIGSGNSYLKNATRKYTLPITYNANGGTGGPGTGTKTYGKSYTIPTTKPTRNGYTFLGWATSKTATTAKYKAGYSYTSLDSTTLYAVWAKADYFTISFNANGGSGAPASSKKYYSKSFTIPSTKPTRYGYTFVGWATSKTAATAKYYAGKTYTSIDGFTLYAVWKAKTYTVTYNANGGSGAPSSGIKTYGKSYTISSTKPTRTGYQFLGWATSKTATTAKYKAGYSYSSLDSFTLYAVWAKNNTVTYYANGGSGAPSSGTKTYGKSFTISSTKPTRTGYQFLGWATSKTATTAKYKAGYSYSSLDSFTLYAVWAKKNTVTYYANGGSGAPSSGIKVTGQSYTIPSTKPTRTGYTFLGWATSKTATTAKYLPGKTYTTLSSFTLYAVWQKK